MTTMNILESLQKFLQNNVCNEIKLKKPSDKNVNNYELVIPNVFIMNLPPKSNLPIGIESAIPCIIVNFDDGIAEPNTASLNIRLDIAIYSPGFHSIENGNTLFALDGEGWRDLVNFTDKIRDTIEKNQVLDNLIMQYPIKYGTYQKEQQNPELDPYFYGWITFPIRKQSYPKAEIIKKYLE
jgi:hypothetical protein